MVNRIIKAFNFYKSLISNRKIIWKLALNDLKARFASSFLGIVWAVITPLCTLLVMWFAFSVGFKAGGVGQFNIPYILWLAPGYLMWAYFSETITSTSNCLREYGYLVKKVNFEVSIIPVVKIVSCSIIHVAFIFIMLLLNLAYGFYPTLYNLQIVYYFFCLFAFEIGLGMIICSLTLFIPDVSSVVSIILQIGFWVNPIIWNTETFADNRIVNIITSANPMYFICRGYRDSMIQQICFWDRHFSHLYFWGFTIALLFLGAYIFHKLRPQFADVL